ncbi:MAG: energy transducer TonB [Candidatus Lokiarchaeia archaeon]
MLLVTLFTLGQRAARREEMELKITEVAYLTKAEIERISGRIKHIKKHKPTPESLLAFTEQQPKAKLNKLMELKETLKISKPAAKANEAKLLQDKIFAGQKKFVPDVTSKVPEPINIEDRQALPDEVVTTRQIVEGGYLQEKPEPIKTTVPIFEVEEKVSDSENLEDTLVIPVQGTLSIKDSSKSSISLREETPGNKIVREGYVPKRGSSEVVTKTTAPPLEISEFKSGQLQGLEIGSREGSSVQGASFQIQGPISAREVVHSVVPSYPRWAVEKGIEPTLTLRFAVLPSGKVKDAIFIIRTSGYPELDKSVIDTLKKWTFKPLPKESLWREEWGEVTFIFSLK